MKLIALMPARNEDWIIGLSARIALMWCDALIVLNHASVDGTAEILWQIGKEHAGRLHLIDNRDSLWLEMEHRQRLLAEARRYKATHIALIDADEILTGNLLDCVRDEIAGLPPGGYLRTRMFCMWRTIERFRHDHSIWSNRRDFVLGFQDTAGIHWCSTNGYDHHQRAPHGAKPAAYWLPAGGVMHLQFADWRRLTAKHALYKATERARWPQKRLAEIDRMYSMALDESALGLAEAPASWWQPYRHLLCHLKLDQEPWQEEECRRLVELHGRQLFDGLNLFGVA